LADVVEDIVSRYNIDAVHIDDYFYPYPIKNEKFPDEEAFRQEPRGFADINAWRRNNVDLAIDTIYRTVKRIKPYVEFGVSPFGVWRNKSKDARGSDTKASANYDDLNADILKWLDEGKIDYVMPQLYWEIGHSNADFAVLAEWWSKNAFGKNLYAGLYASNLGNAAAPKAWRTGNELARQMNLLSKYPNFQGVAIFSAVAIMENRQGIADSLKNHYFKYYALTPENKSNKTEKSPFPPQDVGINFDNENQKIYLLWENDNENEVIYNVVYCFAENEKVDFENPKNIVKTLRDSCLNITELILKNIGKNLKFAVTSVNRYKKESVASQFVDF
jgi:uncharacterized lipoprotein YddW (UPF0748 family)